MTGSSDTIPTFDQVLALVAGRAPLLVEIKDQDGALGPDVGELQDRVCHAVSGYEGPVAIMSFNPHVIYAVKDRAPQIARGLVTDPFAAVDWPEVPAERRAQLAEIPDAEALALDFISHNRAGLRDAPVTRLKSGGLPILTWTIRSEAEETAARDVADNITFEGYLPARPERP